MIATRCTALLLSMGLLMATACQNNMSEVEALTAKKTEVQVETSRTVEITFSDSAIVKAKLYTPVMLHYLSADPYVEMKEGVKVNFYTPEIVIESRLSANYAIRYESRRMVELRNNVVVTNSKGERLDTEQLNWDENKKLLYSDKFVKITTPDKVIYGEGFESNQNFTKYKIFKIKGMVAVKDELQP